MTAVAIKSARLCRVHAQTQTCTRTRKRTRPFESDSLRANTREPLKTTRFPPRQPEQAPRPWLCA
jgi:hypothetical protein